MMEKLKILVVEDNKDNIKAAEALLAGHETAIVSSYDQARSMLRIEGLEDVHNPHSFDVLLTDVMLPKGGYAMMGDEGKRVVDSQGIMPYGAYILFFAIENGIKRTGLITAGDHHSDPFVYALDRLDGFGVGDNKIVITNSCEVYVRTNDYSEIVYEFDKSGDENPLSINEVWKLEEEGKVVRVKNWKLLLEKLLS
jgi:hypothetical protein